ncbi:MAG: ribosomal protein S18-alanine N-acetyltransferase [Paucibacter sp.]|nr:ribosomal protein S18-alanine N-acetyltransferase [Roseateles sp.]
MSALPIEQIDCRGMQLADLDEVVPLELQCYIVPWTRGNFIDSLAAGYEARVLRSGSGELLGYFVAMQGFEEMHLLNITVAPAHQGRGLALLMLEELRAICRGHAARQLWLEVRISNERARAIYRRYGFAEVGLRRGYYPMPAGPREDAVLMSLDL